MTNLARRVDESSSALLLLDSWCLNSLWDGSKGNEMEYLHTCVQQAREMNGLRRAGRRDVVR